MPVNKETLSKIWRKSREKIAELPAAVAEQKTAVRVAVLAVLIVAGATLKSKGQLANDSTEYAQNTYTTVNVVFDYKNKSDSAEVTNYLAENSERMDKAWKGSAETHILTPVFKANCVDIPESVCNAGDNSAVTNRYDAWVNNIGWYEGEGNGRPNTDPNDGVFHVLINHNKVPGAMGTTKNVVALNKTALDPMQPSSKIVVSQELFHLIVSGSSNSGANIDVEADVFGDGSYFSNEPATTPISDYNGRNPALVMSSSTENRTDIEMVEVDGELVPRVCSEYINGSGNPVKFRAIPEDLAVTIGQDEPGDTPPTLDVLYNRTKKSSPYRKARNNVTEQPVPAEIDISKPANTPQVTIKGNIITLTNPDKVLVDNPYSGLPDKIMMFVYPKDNVVNDQNFSRKINGLQRFRVGFTVTRENLSVDISKLLAEHDLKIEDVDFGFVNLGQNGLSVAAIETVINSVREMPKMTDLRMYPNPTNDFLTIETGDNAPISEVYIYNLAGNLVFRENNLAARGFSTNLANLKTGVYIVKVLDGKGEVGRGKIIIQ